MMPFEEGYNRRDGIQEPDWNVIEPDMWLQDSKKVPGPEVQEPIKDSREHDDSLTSVAPVGTTASADPTAYVPLHDPRNQLSSLVKNAQNNEEALQQRNQRVKQSKMRSRKEFGW